LSDAGGKALSGFSLFAPVFTGIAALCDFNALGVLLALASFTELRISDTLSGFVALCEDANRERR
jgi:hypothetical protein